MKKRIVAVAALSALVGAAHADFTIGNDQNNLSFYGTLDLGVGTTNHSYNEDPNSASGNSAMANNGVVGSRLTSLLPSNTTASKWGFKGQRALENGNSAGFVLESQVNVNTGTNPNGRVSDVMPGAGSTFNKGEGSIQGQMFDREASIWLKNNQYGLLKIGRMTTLNGDSMASYDPMSVGYATSPLGMNGQWGAGAYTGDGRWDNSVRWENSYGNIKAGLQYKFGGYTQGFTMGTAESAKIAYETQAYGISLNYQQATDSVSASGASFSSGVPSCTANGATSVTCATNLYSNGLALSIADTRSTGIYGRYELTSQSTLKGGLEFQHFQNGSNANSFTPSNISQMSGLPVNSVAATPFGAHGGSENFRMFWAGANYRLNGQSTVTGAFYKRFDVYADGVSGQANYWSGKYEFAMDKDTTLYATGIVSTVNSNGGVVWTTSGVLIPTTVTYTAGFVYKF